MKYLLSILLTLIIMSCGEQSTSPKDDDVTLIPTVDSVITTNVKTLLTKAVKGQFKQGAEVIHENVNSSETLEGVIADYSTSTLTYSEPIQTALSKETASLIKSTVEGESLNEFAENLEFPHMILQGYTLDDGSDTIQVRLNIISNLIAAKMNGIETVDSYNDSKKIVLADLDLDSNFNVNQTIDDGTISDYDAGRLLAVSGLIMQGIHYIPTKDWDVLPYDDDSKESFKKWVDTLSLRVYAYNCPTIDVCHGNPVPDDIQILADSMTYDVYQNLCDLAETNISEVNKSYRNLIKSELSVETVKSCKEYMKTHVEKLL